MGDFKLLTLDFTNSSRKQLGARSLHFVWRKRELQAKVTRDISQVLHCRGMPASREKLRVLLRRQCLCEEDFAIACPVCEWESPGTCDLYIDTVT
jgi:hypothetical protein